MAKRDEDHGEYGESMKKEGKAPPDEECNAYYRRKQTTKESDFATDVDSEPAPADRDAEVANYQSDRDAGPMNYKKWDRYGGR